MMELYYKRIDLYSRNRTGELDRQWSITQAQQRGLAAPLLGTRGTGTLLPAGVTGQFGCYAEPLLHIGIMQVA